jgi:hypothetical protein
MIEPKMEERSCLPKISANTDRRGVSTPSFEVFCETFVAMIDSPAFGEPTGSTPLEDSEGQSSAASRELRRTGISDSLRRKSLLLKIYRLVIERKRLESERQRIPTFERTIRPNIQDSRHAQQRLATTAKNLRNDFLPRYGILLGEELEQRVYQVIELIEDMRYVLRKREKLQVSRIHPANRKKGDTPSGWELLLKDVDYNLKKISAKAPEQWFYDQVDRELTSLVHRNRGRRLTQATRLKLISAICQASAIGSVEPTAIKEFFRSQKDRASTDLKEN